MNVVWAGLIVFGIAAVAVAAMLLARRVAPEGSYFADGDRAAGVFGVLATGLSLLIGFIVFLAFTSYDTARAGAETEARVVSEQFATTQLLPPAISRRISGELICYARSVVYQEWQAGRGDSDEINPWGVAMFQSLRLAEPRTPSEEAAYGKWLDQLTDRSQARADRLHAGEGVIPAPLWIVLILASVIVLGYMLLFADSGERAFVQAALMASVAIVIVSLLLLLKFLNDPFQGSVGGLKPTAMERTARTIDDQAAAIGLRVSVPCNAEGLPRR
jgi:uncharacterized protein DUF4239